MLDFIILFLIILFAQTIETTTGFGATVVSVGIGAYFFDLKQLVVVLVLIGWLQSLFIVIRAFKHIQWRILFSRILLFASPGMPVGMWFFRHFGGQQLKIILAVFIIFAATLQLFLLLVKKTGLKPLPLSLSALVLFAGGFIHGIFASGGPMVVLYASRALKEKSQFRATLSALWLILGSALIISFLYSKQLTAVALQKTAILIPALVLGIILGELLHQRVNERIFKIAIQFILLLTGVFLLIR